MHKYLTSIMIITSNLI